jgi:hypothetical protein
LNANPNKANDLADEKAAEAFNRLAKQIKVTNPYVDLGTIGDAIREYRDSVQNAELMRLEGKPIGTDPRRDNPTLSPYDNRMRQAEEDLRNALQTEASRAGNAKPSATRGDV